MQNEKKEDHCWFFIGPFIHEGICMCSNYYIINGKKTLISVVTNSAETYKNNKNMSYLGVGEYDSTVQCISCAPQNYPLYQKSLEQQRYNEIEKSVGKADASRLFLMEQFYAPSMSSYPFSMELYRSETAFVEQEKRFMSEKPWRTILGLTPLKAYEKLKSLGWAEKTESELM